MGLRLNDVGTHTAVDGTLAGEDGATVRLAMDLAIEAAREAGDQRGKPARQADVLVQWARDYLTRAHGPGDSLADDAHTVRTHIHVLCRPDQLASAQDAAQAGATPTLDRPAARGPGRRTARRGRIAGDLGTLSRDACADWPATPSWTSSSCSRTAAPTRSTSAGPPGSSAAGCSAPWSPATGTASSRAAAADPPSAPPTTSSTGPTAD